jgi:hypothetical protein
VLHWKVKAPALVVALSLAIAAAGGFGRFIKLGDGIFW